MSALDIITTLLVAVLSSFTHCVAMCGGLNLAFLALNRPQKCEQNAENSQNLQKSNEQNGENSRNSSLKISAQNQLFQKNSQITLKNSQNSPQLSAPNQAHSQSQNQTKPRSNSLFALLLPYHFARICVYMALAAAFYFVGKAALILNQALFFFALGCFMVLLGVALLVRGRLLAFFENPHFFGKILAFFSQKFTLKGAKGALVLGALNGIVPCGLVYFFIVLAMKQESLANALFIMLCFGCATLPALIIFAKITQFFSQKMQKFWTKISYFIIIFYGIYLAFLGFGAYR